MTYLTYCVVCEATTTHFALDDSGSYECSDCGHTFKATVHGSELEAR